MPFLFRVLRIIEHIDVDVAVAGMSKIHDRDAEAAAQGREPGDQFRYSRHRYYDILV